MGRWGPPVLLECVPMQRRGYGYEGGATLSTGRKIARVGSPPRRGGGADSTAGRNAGGDLWTPGEWRAGRRSRDCLLPLDHGGSMLRRSFAVRVLVLSALLALLAPAAASADTFDAAGKGLPD